MNHTHKIGILLALVGLFALTGVAQAQIGGDLKPPTAAAVAGYDLSWWTMDGGGHTFSTGEGYTLGGTAGQPDAGLLAGGGYTLGGGFWTGGAAVMYKIYLPLVLR